MRAKNVGAECGLVERPLSSYVVLINIFLFFLKLRGQFISFMYRIALGQKIGAAQLQQQPNYIQHAVAPRRFALAVGGWASQAACLPSHDR